MLISSGREALEFVRYIVFETIRYSIIAVIDDFERLIPFETNNRFFDSIAVNQQISSSFSMAYKSILIITLLYRINLKDYLYS